jgi:hypothetical protein
MTTVLEMQNTTTQHVNTQRLSSRYCILVPLCMSQAQLYVQRNIRHQQLPLHRSSPANSQPSTPTILIIQQRHYTIDNRRRARRAGEKVIGTSGATVHARESVTSRRKSRPPPTMPQTYPPEQTYTVPLTRHSPFSVMGLGSYFSGESQLDGSAVWLELYACVLYECRS